MFVSHRKPVRSLLPAELSACGIADCTHQLIAGFEEAVEPSSADPGAPHPPGLRLFGCRRHQFLLEARTVVKPGRRLSAAEVETLYDLR